MAEQETKDITLTEINTNPFELPQEAFEANLQLREDNRQTLLDWIKKSLVEGIDFGKIHFVKKSKCPKGSNCQNEAHYSKSCLFKPGAEKISGMLGLMPTFPMLSHYEEAGYSGVDISNIIIRCELVAANGAVISVGVGARNIKGENGNFNKALKMAEKSAHIDATLRAAGLSEIFTQDAEDIGGEVTVERINEAQIEGIEELLLEEVITDEEMARTRKWLAGDPTKEAADKLIQRMEEKIEGRKQVLAQEKNETQAS